MMRSTANSFAVAVLTLVGCSETGAACVESACPCSEAGILTAIAAGGGPYTFDCGGATTLVTEATIVVDNDVVIDGVGDLTMDGNGAHPVLSIAPGVTAELRGLVLSGGYALDEEVGGGITNQGILSLSGVSVSDNMSGTYGVPGGIYNARGATLEAMNCIVTNNDGSSDGFGGIVNRGTLMLTSSTVSDNDGPFRRGGIDNSGRLTLTNTTVSNNTGGNAGGGGISNSGTLTMTNSTISRNGGSTYGGISNNGTASLVNCTVSTKDWRGGIQNSEGGTLTIEGSLVDGPCTSDAYPDGHNTSIGYNVESPGDTCGFDQETDRVSVSVEDLDLGSLQDNGGPTKTHALGIDSVAIDVIPEAACDVDTDQRGQLRPAGSEPKCDVGSFERQASD